VPAVTGWLLRYDGWDPGAEALRETLCALGNGRFVTRAAAPECRAGNGHYPGTYAAGVLLEFDPGSSGSIRAAACRSGSAGTTATDAPPSGPPGCRRTSSAVPAFPQIASVRGGC